MNKEYFNISMNKIGFEIINLKHSNITEIEEEIDKVEKKLDDFKEECLKSIYFKPVSNPSIKQN